MPRGKAETEDFWTHGRRSDWDTVRSYAYFAILIGSFFWSDRYLFPALGLARTELDPALFWLLPVFQLPSVAIHEFGHTCVALALGFRFRSLNIGPLTIEKDSRSQYHFRFDYSRFLGTGGYAGSVPQSDVHLRSRLILVFFAGPLASLLGAISMAVLCLNLAGTRGESYWHAAALWGALFTTAFFTNLLPMGYTDGTMLLHTILWTEKGKDLYSRYLMTLLWEKAERSHQNFDPVQEVELRRRILKLMRERGNANSMQLARAYQALASVESVLNRLPEAEQHYRESIQAIQACPDRNPAFEAQCWYSLNQIFRTRQRVPEARHAYDAAVLAFERAEGADIDSARRIHRHLLLAVLHGAHGNYDRAQREIDDGLEQLPHIAKYFIPRVEFLLTRMNCDFGQGFPERGLESADLSENLLRSPNLSDADRRRATELLGTLGVRLGFAGRHFRASKLLLEAAELCEAQERERSGTGFRLAAAGFLREYDRWEEAEAAFPKHAPHEADILLAFLAERADLYLLTGRVTEAVTDFEAALKLAQNSSAPDPIQIAQRQARLAAAYFAATRLAESETNARAALEVLSPGGHLESALALSTMAMISWGRKEAIGRTYFDEAKRIIEESPFLERSNKALFLKKISRRLESAGRIAEAQEARDAAAEHWRFLGVEMRPAECFT